MTRTNQRSVVKWPKLMRLFLPACWSELLLRVMRNPCVFACARYTYLLYQGSDPAENCFQVDPIVLLKHSVLVVFLVVCVVCAHIAIPATVVLTSLALDGLAMASRLRKGVRGSRDSSVQK